MQIGRKGIKDECCNKESYIIQLIHAMQEKVRNCINKINGIESDGNNNFNIYAGRNINIDQEGNGIRIHADSSSNCVQSLNNKIGDLTLESNDSAILVTDNGNSKIGVQMADWIFDELGSFTTDINDLKDDVTTLQNESKVKTINNVTPNVNGNITIGHGGGLLIRENPSTNSITIQMDSTTYAKIQKVDTLEIDVNTLQNESKIKTINNINPDSNKNFSISAGNNITITNQTNGIEISSTGGGTSSDWSQWTKGTNWTLNNELFNNSRIAQKDMIICNSAGTNINNLYVALNEYIPKSSSFDRAIGWNIMLWGNWTDDKIITSCYVDTSTSTMYTSLSGETIKCVLKYRTISAEGIIGALTSTTMNITKSNLIVYYK